MFWMQLVLCQFLELHWFSCPRKEALVDGSVAIHWNRLASSAAALFSPTLKKGVCVYHRVVGTDVYFNFLCGE